MNHEFSQPDDTNPEAPHAQPDPGIEIQERHEAMLKEIRSWGLWSLGLGVLHIFFSGFLNSAWGALLIIVGFSSFYYRTASMFIVYTVALSWAAISNLVSLDTEWVVMALFQIYLAFRTFKDFRRFKKSEDDLTGADEDLLTASQRAQKSFPWIGSLLGCSSVIGIVVLFFLTIYLGAVYGWESTTPAYFEIAAGLVETFGVLGFAVSLAALISRHKPRALPIIGLIASGLFMVVWLMPSISFI